MNYEACLRGSERYNSALTEDDVRLIRAAARHRQELLEQARRMNREAKQLSNARLAEKFGVQLGTVRSVVDYKTWRHVE